MPRKTAFLVIHGIGDQNPYETLDAFGRGMCDYLRKRLQNLPDFTLRIVPERIRHEDWTEGALHLTLGHDGHEDSSISLFEYYWAPRTQGKVSYLGVLRWLANTALGPILHLRRNLHERLVQGNESAWRSVPRVLGSEILRAAVLYLPLLLLIAVMAYLAVYPPDVRADLKDILKLLRSEQFKEPLVLLASLAIISWMLFSAAMESIGTIRKKPLPVVDGRPPKDDETKLQEATEIKLERQVFSASMLFLIPIFLVTAGLAYALRGSLGLYLLAFYDGKETLLVGLVLVGILWAFKKIFVNYLGDITVYTTTDEKDKSYEARTAILKDSSYALARILKDSRQFDQVIVAGHSLGSVIAYDTINRLMAKIEATSDQLGKEPGDLVRKDDMDRITGLVTFGSPLDKVFYFFRKQVREEQLIRKQMIPFVHLFHIRSAGRKFWPYKFEYDLMKRPKPTNFWWLNVWSRMDPVSGKLDFYDIHPEDQVHRPYKVWGLAHLDYWEDPGFYEAVGKKFLGDEWLIEPVAAAAAGGTQPSTGSAD